MPKAEPTICEVSFGEFLVSRGTDECRLVLFDDLLDLLGSLSTHLLQATNAESS